jgi:hypothetical protein
MSICHHVSACSRVKGNLQHLRFSVLRMKEGSTTHMKGMEVALIKIEEENVVRPSMGLFVLEEEKIESPDNIEAFEGC